jgi:hypothetical protein
MFLILKFQRILTDSNVDYQRIDTMIDAEKSYIMKYTLPYHVGVREI